MAVFFACVIESLLMAAVVSAASPFGAGSSSDGFKGSGSYERQEVVVEGQERAYWLYRPPGQERQRVAVIVIHGYSGTAAQARFYGLEPVADRENFLVLYAEAPEGDWNIGKNYPNRSPAVRARNDFLYFDHLVSEVRNPDGAGVEKVFVAGNSLGGMMAISLACELAERVSGIAAVISGMTSGQFADCRPARSVPFTLLVGTLDRQLPPDHGHEHAISGSNGGPIWLLAYDTTLQFWANINKCSNTRTEVELPGQGGDETTYAIKHRYDGCAAGAVEGIRFVGMGHRWPGTGIQAREAGNPGLTARLGPPSLQTNGAELVWEFFEANALNALYE